jgi:hypothetical protein
MSTLMSSAIVKSGMGVGRRVPIPPELVPAYARVEIDAKIQAGYFAEGCVEASGDTQGRTF